MRKFKKSSYKNIIIILLVFLFAVVAFSYTNNFIIKKSEKINQIRESLSLFNYFLGLSKPLKVLVLFQNNAEARFGGGFIGTVGVIEVEKGKIKSSIIRSVYYYDHKAEAPDYYTELKKTLDGRSSVTAYTLRDSGQNVSWPKNAERAQKIFEKESGIKSDLVIGATPEVLKAFLEIVGPVYLEDYKKTVTASNLVESVQLEIESGTDKANRRDPKSILTSLANALFNKLSKKSLVEIIGFKDVIFKMVKQRHIVLFSKDQKIQQILNGFNATGKIISFDGDYLQLSERSISGTKTGPYIIRSLKRSIKVDDSGRTIIDLNFKRQHTATDRLYMYYDPVWGGYNYLVGHDEVEVKVILPKGTKILSSSVDIKLVDREDNFDIYSYRILTDVNSISNVDIELESSLRNFISDKFQYNSYLQLSVGAFPINITDCISVPSGYFLQSSNRNLINNSETRELCYDAKINEDYKLNLNYAK